MKYPKLKRLRQRILKKDELNRMKNQRDVSKILRRPFILTHRIETLSSLYSFLFLLVIKLGR